MADERSSDTDAVIIVPASHDPESLPTPTPGEILASGAAATVADADLIALASDIADAVRDFLALIEAIAGGEHQDEAIALLLLELSALAAEGARLGAHRDVVPEGRFEPDAGPEPDVDPVREALREAIGAADEYIDVVDPYAEPEMAWGSVADDLTLITSDLVHGLIHYQEDRIVEAVWWWQFSFLTSWGPAMAASLRAVTAVVSHARTGDIEDAEEDILDLRP
jgi:hypothetical protein